MHGLFEKQVLLTPSAEAVRDDGAHNGGRISSLSYADLNARALALATVLRANGVTCESLVAIAVHRCVGLLVGILGEHLMRGW